MTIYTKFLDKVITLVEYFLMVLLAAAILIVGSQITFRYIFNSPLSWSEQGARFLFIWLTMMSVPCIFRRKGMIAFDLITGMFPERTRTAVEILVQFIVMFFAVFYLYTSLTLMMKTGSRVTAGVAIPQNLIYVAPPISMTLLILVLVEQFIQSVGKLKGGKAA